jgi:hypothetical protein
MFNNPGDGHDTTWSQGGKHAARRLVGCFASVLWVGCSAAVDDEPLLRPDGPPDVLSVMVARNRFLSKDVPFLEESTYCRVNDHQRPSRVSVGTSTVAHVCPDDYALPVPTFRNAFPAYWYARIVFDELLSLDSGVPDEPNAATSTEVLRAGVAKAKAQPVTLTCNGADVPFNAYYVTGNIETWPVGPSLKIKPIDTKAVPANALCEVTLVPDVIQDKTGNPPDAAQLGPYSFQIAPISILIPNDPAADAYSRTGVVPTLGPGNPAFLIAFNHYVDPATFDASDVKVYRDATVDDPLTPVKECGGGNAVAAKIATATPAAEANPSPSAMAISDGELAFGDWAPDTQYRVEIGGTSVADVAGGSNILEPVTLCFHTR